MKVQNERWAALLAGLAMLILALPGCGDGSGGPSPQPEKSGDVKTETKEEAKVKADEPEKEEGQVKAEAPETKEPVKPRVALETTMGAITLELDPERAPITVKNFLGYVEKGHYENTVFHRVIGHFMIQGGGFTPEGMPKPTGTPIRNEADNGLKNVRGTIAMARTGEPHSATSQFYINVVDNPGLDHRDMTIKGYGYAVFGRVVEGMDVVDTIRYVRTEVRGAHQNWPIEPVIVTGARKL